MKKIYIYLVIASLGGVVGARTERMLNIDNWYVLTLDLTHHGMGCSTATLMIGQ